MTNAGCAPVWTDHTGTVHERHPDDLDCTLCGLNAGESDHVVPVRACRPCVDENLRRYAITHDCTVSCYPHLAAASQDNVAAPREATSEDQFPAGAPIPDGDLSGRSPGRSLGGRPTGTHTQPPHARGLMQRRASGGDLAVITHAFVYSVLRSEEGE